MKRTIFFLLVFAVLLCGCDTGYNKYSAGASDYYDAMNVIQMCVPYIGPMDLRLDSITLLETDSYGRSLLRYDIVNSRSSVLLIIQKTSEPLTYYYEDYCYIIRKSNDPSDTESRFSEQDKDWLKEHNDWNEPLDHERMRCINYKDTSPQAVNVKGHLDVRESIKKHLEAQYPEKDWVNANIGVSGLETYADRGQLIFVQLYYSENIAPTEYYLVLYNYDSAKVVHQSGPIYRVDDFRDCIIAFKESYCRSIT